MEREAKTKLPTTGSPQDTSYNEKWVKLVVHSHTHTRKKNKGRGERERLRGRGLALKALVTYFGCFFSARATVKQIVSWPRCVKTHSATETKLYPPRILAPHLNFVTTWLLSCSTIHFQPCLL